MFKALSEGHRAFRRVAVVADTEAPTPPCGACRQILWEFGGDLEVDPGEPAPRDGDGISSAICCRCRSTHACCLTAVRRTAERVLQSRPADVRPLTAGT